MPIDYVIDKKLGTIFMRATGEFTDNDLLDCQQRVSEDSAFDPEYLQLVDYSQVKQFSVTKEGLQLMASRTHVGVGSRRAIIAPTDISFGMSRMSLTYRELRDQFPGGAVFRTKDEAVRWLGIVGDPDIIQ